jgi:hypothetical protein
LPIAECRLPVFRLQIADRDWRIADPHCRLLMGLPIVDWLTISSPQSQSAFANQAFANRQPAIFNRVMLPA